MRPKISVIVPIFNTEKYLDKCLFSIRNQTFKNIEIICVDDCSVDGSYKVIEKHIQEDERVILIRHQENLGPGGARNTAIHIAKADYLASVDSDDFIDLNMLKALWEGTDGGSVDIVSCGFDRIDEKGKTIGFLNFQDNLIKNENNSIDIFTTLNTTFWNKLWRKSLFVNNDIFFPNHVYFEDMSTIPRIATKARSMRFIAGRYYKYIARQESIIGTSTEKHLVDYLKGFEHILRHLEESNLRIRYKEEFYQFINIRLLYYAKNLLLNESPIEVKKQNLLLLVLFKFGFNLKLKADNYIELDDFSCINNLKELEKKFAHTLENTDMHEDSIVQMLGGPDRNKETIKLLRNKLDEEKTKLLNIKLKEEKTKLLNNKLNKEISFTQMTAIFSFMVFGRLFMSQRQTTKLINNPSKFFIDSKSSLARKYASIFNII